MTKLIIVNDFKLFNMKYNVELMQESITKEIIDEIRVYIDCYKPGNEQKKETVELKVNSLYKYDRNCNQGILIIKYQPLFTGKTKLNNLKIVIDHPYALQFSTCRFHV